MPSEGERESASDYCRGTGGGCQREMAGFSNIYPAEVTVTFSVCFYYKGKG